VLLDVKTYCINRATMCLVINNENHPLRMADNVCLVYGPHYNKIQILILDSFKVSQGLVAINMRVSSQDANPFHVVAELLKNTTLQFIVQPDSLRKGVNFHSYIQVHEADLFQIKENIHFEIHQSRKSQESRSEQFLKKNICPLQLDDNEHTTNLIQSITNDPQGFSLTRIYEEDQQRRNLFQNQIKGDLLTNIVITRIEDTECKGLLESLTISDLKKLSTKEIHARLREFHFQCCIKHGLVLLVEQQQRIAIELVEKLPPHENPNPSRLKVIFFL
jgi:hypothetical protein